MPTTKIERCLQCSGSGKIHAGCSTCPTCDGAGALQVQNGKRIPYREPPLKKPTILEAMAHDLNRDSYTRDP